MQVIHAVNDIRDPLLYLVKDDPVRQDLFQIERVIGNKEVLVLMDNNNPAAVVCVSYQDFIPSSEKELISSNNPTIAIFYSIWSYRKGSGKLLIFAAKEYIKERRQEIRQFVTLSPQTDIAAKFHYENGAKFLRTNDNSVNYEYP